MVLPIEASRWNRDNRVNGPIDGRVDKSLIRNSIPSAWHLQLPSEAGSHPMNPSSSFRSRRPGHATSLAVLIGLPVILSVMIGGCADEKMPGVSEGEAAGSASSNLKQVGLVDRVISKDSLDAIPSAASATPGEKSKAPGEAEAPAGRPAIPRKIIYDARVELLVDSLSTAEQAVLDLIKEHNGFLAESDQASVTSTQRRATWKVRVPVDHFDAFLNAVCRLGEVKQNHLGSQDVTEEYFDVEARIRNKQEEEKRLLKHLSDSTGKLEDILAVERELSRVRGEVEQMQGRLRMLANRTELSTITIEATEWKDYKPPIAPTFPTQLGRTFFNSLDNLFAFGKAMAMVAVAIVPWLPLIIVGLLLLRWLVRANRGSRATGHAPSLRLRQLRPE